MLPDHGLDGDDDDEETRIRAGCWPGRKLPHTVRMLLPTPLALAEADPKTLTVS